MLKAELHTHIDLDPVDKVRYSYQQLIDRAAELHYNVLAITCHNALRVTNQMQLYARSKGIILLAGAELTIEGKHTLVYGISEQEAAGIRSLYGLACLKRQRPEIMVIAPHPYHLYSACLKDKIIKHLDLFDAWEFSFFHARFLPLNNKVVRLSKRYQKPLVGNSDVHSLRYLGKTYTLIDSPKRKDAIITAIKLGKTKVVSAPLTLKEFVRVSYLVVRGMLRDLWMRHKQ